MFNLFKEGIVYCENSFDSFSKRFVMSFTVFVTGYRRPSLYFFTGINEMAYFLSFHSLSDELE